MVLHLLLLQWKEHEMYSLIVPRHCSLFILEDEDQSQFRAVGGE